MRKTLSFLAYMAAAFIIAYFIVDRHSSYLEPGHKAPMAEEVLLIDGQKTTFKAFAKKPLLVNFWATWCPPCQKELPVLSKAHKKYRDRVNFLGIAIDSNINDILAFKAKYFVDYPIGYVSQPSLDKWQAQILPTTYLVGKNGKILWGTSGEVTSDQLESAINLHLSK